MSCVTAYDGVSGASANGLCSLPLPLSFSLSHHAVTDPGAAAAAIDVPSLRPLPVQRLGCTAVDTDSHESNTGGQPATAAVYTGSLLANMHWSPGRASPASQQGPKQYAQTDSDCVLGRGRGWLNGQGSRQMGLPPSTDRFIRSAIYLFITSPISP